MTLAKKNYLGHIAKDGREQTLLAHLEGTATLAKQFAEPYGLAEEAWLAGMLHDLGKGNDRFQRHLHGAKLHVDHSTYGAILAAKQYGNPCIATCIAGHHAGIPDYGDKRSGIYSDGSLWGRLKAKEGADIEQVENILADSMPPKYIPQFPKRNADFYLRTKLLYSALTDADFLDTESFMNGNPREADYESIEELSQKLDDLVASFGTPQTEINRYREEIRKGVLAKAELPQGVFTLTVPTGGGKTLTSMQFALHHAIKNGMKRVIYVIPFTSIIEQTQKVFEDVFGRENVLTHYATADCFVKDGADDSENALLNQKRLATENWDAPIVLTTAVQFFESFYSNKSSRCRKLHNVANSVLVFDEAQTLPVPMLRPCLFVIAQLARFYRCSPVLCTATQPSVGEVLSEDIMLGDMPITELCPMPVEMYQRFRRVRYVDDGTLDNEGIISKMLESRQCLCIVNKRAHARVLYELLPEESRFHLSTWMTPSDRKLILSQIRERLSQGEACHVVSTSLIEAGVDIDFPSVLRAFTGIDSIIQAAGRCNREGKRDAENSIVHFFIPQDEVQPKYLRQNAAAANSVIRRYEDIASPEAVKAYFDFLFSLKGEFLDEQKLLADIQITPFDFKTYSERFCMIEADDCSVVIPCEENRELLAAVEQEGVNRRILRQLGFYSVNVPYYVYQRLKEEGAIQPLNIAGNVSRLVDESRYSPAVGLDISEKEMQLLAF